LPRLPLHPHPGPAKSKRKRLRIRHPFIQCLQSLRPQPGGIAADEGILEVFELIREQRDEAIAAQKEAEYQKKKVEDAQQAINTQSRQLQAGTLRSLASSYLNQGRYNEALQVGLQAYEIDPSADSEQIVAQSYQETLKKGGVLLLREFQLNQKEIYRLDMAPDNRYFLAAHLDNTVGIWTLQGALIHQLKTENRIVEVVFSPNGQYFILITQDHQARLYSADGKEIAPLELFIFDKNSSIEFSPKSQYILYYQNRVSGRIWNTKGEVLNDAYEQFPYISATADVPFFSLETIRINFFANSEYILTETKHGAYLTDVYGRFFPTYVEQGDTLYFSKNGPPPFPPPLAPSSLRIQKKPDPEDKAPKDQSEETPKQEAEQKVEGILDRFKDLLETEKEEKSEPNDQKKSQNEPQESRKERKIREKKEELKERLNEQNDQPKSPPAEEEQEQESPAPVFTFRDTFPRLEEPDLYSISVREAIDMDSLLRPFPYFDMVWAQENNDLKEIRILQLFKEDSVSYPVYFKIPMEDFTQRQYRVTLSLVTHNKAEAERASKQIIYYTLYNRDGKRSIFEKIIEYQHDFIAFTHSTDYEYMVSASAGGEVQVWDLTWPDKMCIQEVAKRSVTRIAPSNDYILTHEPPFNLNIFDLNGKRRNKAPIRHQNPNQIKDGSCFLKEGAVIKTEFGKTINLYSPDGELISTKLDTLLQGSKSSKIIRDAPTKIYKTASLEQFNRKMVVDSLQQLLLQTSSGSMIKRIPVDGNLIFSLEANEASGSFLVSTDQERLYLLNADGDITQSFNAFGSARFSPQGNYIITQNNQWVKIWTREGKVLYTFPYDDFIDFAADESFFLIHQTGPQRKKVVHMPKGLQQLFDHSPE
jgi:WD40 repeat protein